MSHRTIAIVGSFWRGSLEESYARGFENIGWHVARIDIDPVYPIPNGKLFASLAKTPVLHPLLSPLEQWWNAHELSLDLSQARPDIIIVFKGLRIGPKVIRRIRSACGAVPIVSLNPDSPWERRNSSPEILEAISLYDHHFTWSKALMRRFIDSGATSVSYLPFAYDPELHYPQHPTKVVKTKTYDAVFLGTYDPIRDKLLGSLEGCKIGIWGNDWHRAKLVPRSCIIGKALYGEDGVHVLAQGRVALNILRDQNKGSHNMRTFEIPATKQPMLTTRSAEQSGFFTEGKEMLCFETAEELSLALISLRSEQERLDQIAESGNIRVKSETYHKRAETIVATLRIL